MYIQVAHIMYIHVAHTNENYIESMFTNFANCKT